MTLDLETLNPGIRTTVALLRAHGFRTCPADGIAVIDVSPIHDRQLQGEP